MEACKVDSIGFEHWHDYHVAAAQAVQQLDSKGRSGAASTQKGPEQRHMEAKMILKLGQWMADTGQGGRSDITGQLLAFLIPSEVHIPRGSDSQARCTNSCPLSHGGCPEVCQGCQIRGKSNLKSTAIMPRLSCNPIQVA